MILNGTQKVGHRAYDNLLIDIIQKINSFVTREELIEIFSDRLSLLSSFSYLTVLETSKETIDSLDDLDIFYFRAKRNEDKLKAEIFNKMFNKRTKAYNLNYNIELFNNYIKEHENNIGWGTVWTNLSFCLKFIPHSEYSEGGWINMIYLKRATVKHPHRFMIVWYPMRDEDTLPSTFAQDERTLYFFKNFYNLVSFSLKSKAKNIYEQKINLLKDIAPSTISHEILTNIAQPIYTFEDIKEHCDNEMIREIFERNIEMLKYTKEMANSLLLFTKRASNVEVSLDALFLKIKNLTKHILARDSAILHIDHDSNLFISSDEGLLMQILINLIMNALEAYKDSDIEDNREIFLQSNLKTYNQIEILVSDNALGISEELEKEIFEQGFTTKKSSGHGLGLTISSYISKYLGGKLTIDRSSSYKTTFLLLLPKEYKIEQEIEEEALW